jgi:auxin response factor
VVVVVARPMGIDLNMADGESKERRPPPAVCRELWHACAGPVVALPRRGSLVVYLPQGHLAAAGGGNVAVDLPPHVACRVADVELCVSAAVIATSVCFAGRGCIGLHCFDDEARMAVCTVQADAATDEVYARLALVAEGEVKKNVLKKSPDWIRMLCFLFCLPVWCKRSYCVRACVYDF